MRPRDAFFGPCEVVPIESAAGRIAAEQVTPYAPGIPVIVPGELVDGRSSIICGPAWPPG